MASPQNEAVVKQQSDTLSSLSSPPPPYSHPANANRSYNNASSYDNPPSYSNNTLCSAPPFLAAPPYQHSSTQYGMPPPPPPPPPSYAASAVPVVVQPSFYAQQTTSHVIIVSRSMHPSVDPSVFIDHRQRVSIVGAIVLSCFAFWCCGLVFGGFAFLLAMISQSSATAGDTRGAIRLRNASYALSAVAIVIGGLIIGLVVAFSIRAPYSNSRYSYYYYFY